MCDLFPRLMRRTLYGTSYGSGGVGGITGEIPLYPPDLRFGGISYESKFGKNKIFYNHNLYGKTHLHSSG